MYRLTDHQLEIEKGRYKKEWKPRELQVCKHCSSEETETEVNFLLCCLLYQTARDAFLQQIKAADLSCQGKTRDKLMKLCLGEEPNFMHLVAKYVSLCHDIRGKNEMNADYNSNAI